MNYSYELKPFDDPFFSAKNQELIGKINKRRKIYKKFMSKYHRNGSEERMYT